jgi:hypothetical protein
MVKKLVVSLLVLLTLSVLFITYEVMSYAPSAPVFSLQNNTEQPINVLAKWRDKSKTFKLTAKQETEFTVNDEASMDFIVTFKNGKSISGTLGYFTTGTKAKVVITETEVKIASGV